MQLQFYPPDFNSVIVFMTSEQHSTQTLSTQTIVLASILGEDRCGITSTVTEILAQHHVTILDIGQAVIHNHLNLGMLLAIPQTVALDKLHQTLKDAAQALR